MNVCSTPTIGIIGGGIAGSVCAYRLASKGFSVTIFDKEVKKSRKICGEYLCPSGVNLLSQIFESDENPIASFGSVEGMNIFTAKDTVLHTRFPSSNKTSGTKGVSVNRSVLDENLIQLAEKSGANVHRNHRIKSIDKVDGQWELMSQAGEIFKFDILVGADGKGSFTAHKLGLVKETASKRAALHVILSSGSTREPLGEMHLFRDGAYVGVNPIEGRECNLSLVCDGSSINEHGGALKTLQFYLDQSKSLSQRFKKVSCDTEITSTYPVSFEVTKCVGPDFALIGDAGGFYDPLTGEGMYYAMWSGNELSEQILAAKEVSRESIHQSLYLYGQNRKKVFREKKVLLVFFQWVIKHPLLCQMIFWFLNNQKVRGDIFVGIVGNIYAPLAGLRLLLRTLLSKEVAHGK